ncbi:MAG: PAS-domain containing protein [Proteobacteria bacterium]|nr:PAS-domain containing protein [Pseudomonadota bacterium]MBI3496350.1 PAS-domain containing protein [Pseudomonadota bacterium]
MDQAELRPDEVDPAMLRETLDALDMAVTVYGSDNRLVYWNGAAAEYFPQAAESLQRGISAEERDRSKARAGYVPLNRPFTPGADGASREEWNLRDGRRLLRRQYRTRSGGLITTYIDLTRRFEAEIRTVAALSAEVERDGLIIDATREGIYDHDCRQDSSWCSTRAHEILGLGPDALNGQRERFFALMHPDDLASYRALLLKAESEHSRFFSASMRMRHSDGTWRWIAERARLVYAEDARLARMVGSFGDVTKQHEAEEALRRTNEELEQRIAERTAHLQVEIAERRIAEESTHQAEQKLIKLFEILPVGLVVFDANERLAEANEQFFAMYPEIERDAFANATAAERIRALEFTYILNHPGGRPYSAAERREWQERRAGQVRAGIPDQCEVRSLSGRISRLISARTTDGRLIQVHHDITDLRQAEARLQDAIDNIPAGIVMFDRNMRLSMINKATRERTGTDVDRIYVPGMPLEEHVRLWWSTQPAQSQPSDAELEALVANRLRSLNSAQPDTVETRTKSGRLLRLFTARTSEGGLVQVGFDITETRQAEERLIDGINALDDSLAIYDRDDRLAIFNEAYRLELAPIAHLVTTGRHFLEIHDAIWEAGIANRSERTKEEWLKVRINAHRAATGVPVEYTRLGRHYRNAVFRTRGGETVRRTTDITDLRDAEQKLRKLFELMPVGVALCEGDGRMSEANDFYFAMYPELSSSDVIGKTIEERVTMPGYHYLLRHPDGDPFTDAEAARWKQRRISDLREGTPATVELRTPSGRIARVTSARTEDGKLILVHQDITELRQAQVQLSDLVDGLDSSILLFDSDQRLVLWNASTRRLFPRFAELLQRAMTHDQAYTLFRETGYGAPGASANAAGAFKPGTRIWQLEDGRSIEARRMRTGDGAFIITHTDISAIKQAEKRLHDAVSVLNDSFALFDAEDRLVMANEACHHELLSFVGNVVPGTTYEEILGKFWDAGVVPATSGRTREKWLNKRMAEHHAADGQPIEVRRNGRVLRVTEYRTGQGETVRLSIDVTDLRRAEERLQTAINAMSDSFVLFDADERLVLYNDAAMREFAPIADTVAPGVARRDVSNAVWNSGLILVPPNMTRDEWFEKREALYRAADGRPFEVRRPGQIRRVSETRTPTGETLYLSSDITDLRRAEERLVEAINAISDRFALYDRDDRLVLCNEPYRQVLNEIGVEITPDLTFEAILRSIWRSGRATGDGIADEEGWVALRMRPHREATGEPYEVYRAGRHVQNRAFRTKGGETVRLTTDVTVLRHAETRLIEAVNALDNSFALFDENDRLVLHNDAYRRSLEAAGPAFRIGMTYRELCEAFWEGGGAEVDGMEKEAWLEDRLTRHREATGQPLEIRRGDHRIRSMAFRTRSRETVRLVVDVTDLRRAEERLVEAINAMTGRFGLYDRDDRLVLCNEAYREELIRLGAVVSPELTFEQVLRCIWRSGEAFTDGVADVEEWVATRMRLHRAASGIPYEVVRDGRYIQNMVYRTTSGETVRLTADVTDLRRAESRLVEAINSIGDGFALFDNNDRLVLYNDAYRRQLAAAGPALRQGMSYRELCEAFWDAGMAADDGMDKDAWMELFIRRHREGSGKPIEIRRKGRNFRSKTSRTSSGETVRLSTDITDLRRAESRLLEAINSLGESFALYDENDRLVLYNDAYAREIAPIGPESHHGITYRQLCERFWEHGLVSAEGMSREQWLEDRLRRHREASGESFEIRRGDRQFRSMAFRTLSGETVRLTVDVTDLRRAEERLMEAINAMTDRFALYDRSDRLVLFNEAFRTGFARVGIDITPGLTFVDLAQLFWKSGGGGEDPNEGDPAIWLEERLKPHRDASGIPHEISRNGRHLRNTVSRTRSGEIVNLISDVTDLRQIETELRRSLAEIERLSQAELAKRSFLLQSVMDTLPSALVILDGDGKAIFWNHGFLKMAELIDRLDSQSGGPVQGSSLAALLRMLQAPDDMADALLTAGTTAVEANLPGDRTLHFELLDTERGNRLLIAQDVTLERREAADRMAVQERLLQAQKAEAIGTMAGTVAHDFNNMLTVVMGFASLSQGQVGVARSLVDKLPVGDPKAARKSLRILADAIAPLDRSLANIVEGAARGRAIVDNLNNFAKAKSGAFECSDLAVTVREAGKLARISLPSSAALHIEAPPDQSLVLHDKVRMEQALINLCLNASHALEGKPGTVTLKLERIEVDGSRAEELRKRDIESSPLHHIMDEHADGAAELWRGTLSQGPHFRIEVCDSGSGMGADVLAHIFEPFFTTKPAGTGTGLGLPSVAGIVESHGGAVHVRSKKGQGTSFNLLLPLSAETIPNGKAAETAAPAVTTVMVAASGASPASEEGALRALAADVAVGLTRMERQSREAREQAPRILVVDDEEHVCELLEMTLLRAGFEVEAYLNSTKALARIKEDPAGFDLIVTDQTMPNVTGTMLAETAHALRSDMPVLICTAFSAKVLDDRNPPPGVVGIIRKPFAPKDVVDRIRVVLATAEAARRRR